MDVKRYESKDVSPASLGEPIHFDFSGRTAPNRLMKASMTERMSSYNTTDQSSRGIPTEELLRLYEAWAEGEYGLILTGNILIDTTNLEAAGNLIIPQDAPLQGERFDQFAKLARLAKSRGSLCLGQVNHPGRQCSTQFQLDPVSASDVQLLKYVNPIANG